MNSLVTPVSKKARKKMRAAVALLAQQGARQKAAASEAQAEASLALECDKPRTRSTGDSWTAKGADRVHELACAGSSSYGFRDLVHTDSDACGIQPNF